MAFKHTVEINGVDISDYIALNSYEFQAVPVYSDKVTTMDGVDHIVLKRTKATLSFSLNPLSLDDSADLCEAFKTQPASVYFYDSSLAQYRYATMIADLPTLTLINRLIHNDKRWNEVASVTLEEL